MAGQYEMTRLMPCPLARMSATAHVVLHRLGMPVAQVGSYGEVIAYAPNAMGDEREVVTVFFRDAGAGQTLVTVRSECRNVTLVTDRGRSKRYVREVIDALFRAVTVVPGPPPVVTPPPVFRPAEPAPDPNEILMRRYVNGEIDLEEFERLQRALLAEEEK